MGRLSELWGRLRGEVQGRAALPPRPAGAAAPIFLEPDEAPSDALWIDVRDAFSFALGHVPGAARVSWWTFTQGPRSGELREVAELEARLRRLGVRAARPVVVVGSWERGWGEEGHLAWLIDYLGHPEVAILYGGMGRLVASGMRMERGPGASPPQGDLRASLRPRARATTAEVRAGLQAPLIDVRSAREWARGHVPGARHVPWREVFDASGGLRPPEALRARFGLSADAADAVLYCAGGVRSAFVTEALRWAGVGAARSWDGSWWAWRRQEA